MGYRDIRNIKELDQAIEKAHSRSSVKRRCLEARWEDACEAYCPTGLIASGIKSISGTIPFDRIALRVIRLLKSILLR